jgi:hypothetical protein
VTDLKNRFMLMLTDEPQAPDDLERIVSAGRRARRHRQVAVATAGTVGVAALGAAVAIPVALTGGGGKDAVNVAVKPSPTPSPSATTGKCYLVSTPSKAAKLTVQRLVRSGKVGSDPTVRQLPKHSNGRTIIEVCAPGASITQPDDQAAEPPAGPRYHYTEEPHAIASRLAAHLNNRVTDWGLDISYTRPFAQETSQLEKGHPAYYDGNVDVREANGYGDIGVQVIHKTTQQVSFTGDCKAADNCAETTLPDGSVLRTGEVNAGPGLTVVTAEVHRTDGVVVQAQMSNYPFGPDAGTQDHGDQPLALKQLISLAQDPDFTF